MGKQVDRLSEGIATTLKDFNSDFEWFLQNREGLLSRYGGKWVAVRSKEILDSDGDLSVLVHRLKAKGFQTEELLIQFLSKEPIEAIL
jgi:hypothetical protein